MANYVEMWKDLGMDLEAHNALCEVLPTAFGDIYLSQENRPESMGFWDLVVADIHGIRPAELIEAQKKGQKVFGTFCVYVPDEVVIAPAPRSIQGELGCGMSLLIQPEDIERVRDCIARNEAEYYDIVPLPCQIKPGRNRFC